MIAIVLGVGEHSGRYMNLVAHLVLRDMPSAASFSAATVDRPGRATFDPECASPAGLPNASKNALV